MSDKIEKETYRCYTCSRSGIKLYRPYGEFLRDERIQCTQHVPPAELNWYVPLVVASDGEVWGYTSAPESDIEKWNVLDS